MGVPEHGDVVPARLAVGADPGHVLDQPIRILCRGQGGAGAHLVVRPARRLLPDRRRGAPPDRQHRLAELLEDVAHALAAREQRRAVLVLEDAAEDGEHAAEPGVVAGVEGIGLVPVEEAEPPPPELPGERRAHVLEEGVIEEVRADEVGEVDVVVAGHVHGLERGEVVEDLAPLHEEEAEVHLPELEEVAEDEELAPLAAHVIEEGVERSRLPARLELVAHATVPEVQIAHDEDVSGRATHAWLLG